MYYLFLFSLITTIVVFLLKYEIKDQHSYRNCSEYMDPYGNLTIETHKYIYKMSRENGRLFRRLKESNNSNSNSYRMIHSKNDNIKTDKLLKGVVFNPITGKSSISE